MAWTAKQREVRDVEKRRVFALMSNARRRHPPPTQAEVDASVAAFLAKGGEVKVVSPTAPPVQLVGDEAPALSHTD